MKGKLKGVVAANIEFIMSFAIFVGIVTFVTFTIMNTIPDIAENGWYDSTKSSLIRFSDVVLFDTNETKFGMSTGEKYMLSGEKIDTIGKKYCDSEYMYNITGRGFVINVTSANKNIQCGDIRRPFLSVRRFGILDSDNEVARVEIGVTY